MSRFNPLFDKLPAKPNVLRGETTAAAMLDETNFVGASTAPVSPHTGKRMTPVMCGTVPCFVDLDTRTVLPAMNEG